MYAAAYQIHSGTVTHPVRYRPLVNPRGLPVFWYVGGVAVCGVHALRTVATLVVSVPTLVNLMVRT